jgi:hypothetical protein
MIVKRPRRQVPAWHDWLVDRPRAQDIAHLEHEIPVNPVPVVFEYNEL